MNWIFPSIEKNFDSPFSVEDTLRKLKNAFKPLNFWNYGRFFFVKNGKMVAEPLIYFNHHRIVVHIHNPHDSLLGSGPGFWREISILLRPIYYGTVMKTGIQTCIQGRFRHFTITRVLFLLIIAGLLSSFAYLLQYDYTHNPATFFHFNTAFTVSWLLALLFALTALFSIRYSFRHVNYNANLIAHAINSALTADSEMMKESTR